jgi:predicted naringenin-chalcone synthase
MGMTLLGIGTAVPDHRIAQTDAAVLATSFVEAEPGHERLLATIYRQTRIRSRGSVLLEDPGPRSYAQEFFPPASSAGDGGPSTAARMERYAAEAGRLAGRAAVEALAAAEVEPAAVTHLVTCSCTGFANPGVDLEIIAALGLAPTVSRTHVGFMGCHGAFNALRVAAAFTAAQPDAVVLVVCVELCSLHFQYGSRSDLIVANSIFADGAGAVVGVGSGHPASGRRGRWRLERQWSSLLAESRDEMGWTIGDHGFEMNLAATVPATIGRELPGIVGSSLDEVGLAAADIDCWAVHPGGPRVLLQVRESLGLSAESLAISQAVLAEHGNMSSATILFILERLLKGGAQGRCAAMAFGPGLTAELAVLTVER